MIGDRKIFSIDLGTKSTRIAVRKKGLAVNQPTLVLMDKNTNHFISYGEEAEDGAPSGIKSAYMQIKPIQHSVIADYKATKAYLSHYLYSLLGRVSFKKPDAILTISGNANSSERRALLDACYDSGFKKVYLLPTIYACALGAGLNIREPKGRMIINFGAGGFEVATFSMGGIVSHQNLKLGGNDIDEAITQKIRREYGVVIDKQLARNIKESYVNVNGDVVIKPLRVEGRRQRTKELKKITIANETLMKGITPYLERMVRSAKKVINDTPPDLIADIMGSGVLMTGGLSQMQGLDIYFSKSLKLACFKADQPALCSVRGALIAITHAKDFEKQIAD